MRSSAASEAVAKGLEYGVYVTVVLVTLLYSGMFQDNLQAKTGALQVMGGAMVLLMAGYAMASRRLQVHRLPL